MDNVSRDCYKIFSQGIFENKAEGYSESLEKQLTEAEDKTEVIRAELMGVRPEEVHKFVSLFKKAREFAARVAVLPYFSCCA